jgi:hypothetical protein
MRLGTIILAWLGLAGVSDAIVDWQLWFEHGIMSHWRSTKEWITAVLLWWLPFSLPSWTLDYFLLGGIVARAKPPRKWVVPDGFDGPQKAGGDRTCEVGEALGDGAFHPHFNRLSVF